MADKDYLPTEHPPPPGWPLYFLLSASCRGVGLIPLQLLRSHADIVECSKTPRRPPLALRTAGVSLGCLGPLPLEDGGIRFPGTFPTRRRPAERGGLVPSSHLRVANLGREKQ